MRLLQIFKSRKAVFEPEPDIALTLMNEDDYSRVRKQRMHQTKNTMTSLLSSCWSGIKHGPAPSWWRPDLDMFSLEVCRIEADRVFYFPSNGALVTEDGFILPHTYHQAKYAYANMYDLREFWPRRSKAIEIKKAAVTMGWGALHNYGHFLLDALTSVPVLGTKDHLTPPLKAWQRDHYGLAGVRPVEMQAECCFIRRVSYTTNMRAILHWPNAEIDKTLCKIQTSAVARNYNGSPHLYISRRGHKRPCRSEPQLEQALAERGFKIVQPEELSVSEQIDLFRSADTIVALTGAALANLLYAKPGVRVIEILPKDMTLDEHAHKWVAYLTAIAGGDWRPFFCDEAEEAVRPEVGGEQRMGYLPFDLDVDELLKFIFAV